ncbi:MAG: hypothetical protein EBS01_12270, partial [Verrucomicrobia bacterium]|nr:hypothetical protein [Verrucomicrobiota bacterium]
MSLAANDGGTVGLLTDGDGTGTANAVSLGAVAVGASPVLSIGRGGTTVLFSQAVNKTIMPATFSSLSNGLTLNAANGYGLSLSDSFTLAGGSFNITPATASNVVQGLTLNGVIDGTSGLVKAGSGTVVLGNSANIFTGSVNVSAGVLAVASDGALGSAANGVILASGTAATLRAMSSFELSASRKLYLSNSVAANNVIEVVGGATLAFNGTFGTANGFQKADNGTLSLGTSNAISGTISVSAGALQISDSGALGAVSAPTVVSASGAALRFAPLSVLSIFEPLSLTGSGINSGGALQAGANSSSTVSGTVTLAGATTIGADDGAILSLTGSLAGVQALTLAGAGLINLSGSFTSSPSSITKIGTGTTNLTVPAAGFTGALNVSAGTFVLSNSGSVGATGAITVNSGGSLLLDNSANNRNNRLSVRPVTLAGNLTLTGSSSATVNETIGTLTPASGNSVITVLGGSTALTAAGFGSVGAGATFLVRGTNFGLGALDAGTATFVLTSGATFLGGTGSTGSANKGILPWALVDSTEAGIGTSFATTNSGSSTTGTASSFLRPLGAGESVAGLAVGSNVVLSSAGNFTDASLAVNSLNLGNAGAIVLKGSQTLTISSGGLLLQDGNGGLAGGVLSSGTGSLWVFTPSNTSAVSTISSALVGAFGLTKSGAGTLVLNGTAAGYPTLSANTFSGTTTVNEGVLRLGAGNAL